MLMAPLLASVHFLFCAALWVSPCPAVWIEMVLPHRSSGDLMFLGFPLGTMITQPVAMYGTASALARRAWVAYSAVHTMSQRPAVRSGIRPANETLRTSSCTPQALATARAASTSKPIAWFGSVTDVEGKYSMGGYSMSTQSVTVPALAKLVGAWTVTWLAAALDGDPLPAPPDWHPAMMRPTARAMNRTRADGGVTSSPPRVAGRSSSSRDANRRPGHGRRRCLAGCVRIADVCTLRPKT